MKQKTLTIAIGYLFLCILLSDTACSLINHLGFHNTEQVVLNAEAETNTKDKDHAKDASLNEYYLDHPKLRFFSIIPVLSAKLQLQEANFSIQSFYPAILTPPPNA